jgi:organic radical activating enzyme
MKTGKTDTYCNQKFWWLNVDLTRKQSYSCCSATPAPIDIEWVSNNPGKLFNTPLLQQERVAMLNGDPVESCWDTCFKAESQGLVSRRQLSQSFNQTHTDIEASPRLINVVVGSTCNLTCVYCCKQYSSAWLRDLEQNGSYLNDNRFKIFPNDKVKKHLDIQAENDYKLLVNELNALQADIVHISGGEPFLYNSLYDLVTNTRAKTIKINTGLGVDPVRFQKQIDQLKHMSNVEIHVSGETVGELYELVRYGNTYDRFKTNLQIVQESGLKYTIVSVISNLTVLGMFDFWLQHQDCNFHFLICNDPDFLSVNVLDDITKAQVLEQFQNSQHPARSIILENIDQPMTATQHKNFVTYMQEFTKRRSLSLDLLPDSLQCWITNA